jgi:hypothetical protein
MSPIQIAKHCMKAVFRRAGYELVRRSGHLPDFAEDHVSIHVLRRAIADMCLRVEKQTAALRAGE